VNIFFFVVKDWTNLLNFLELLPGLSNFCCFFFKVVV